MNFFWRLIKIIVVIVVVIVVTRCYLHLMLFKKPFRTIGGVLISNSKYVIISPFDGYFLLSLAGLASASSTERLPGTSQGATEGAQAGSVDDDEEEEEVPHVSELLEYSRAHGDALYLDQDVNLEGETVVLPF
jgi:hypothetical protein